MMRPGLALSVLAACAAIATSAGAGEETPSKQDTTAPKAASSPHQRDATSTRTAEATTTTTTNPAAASSQHQREATKDAATSRMPEHDQMMKDCMKQQQQKDSTLTASQVRKTCMQQMKSHADQKKSQ